MSWLSKIIGKSVSKEPDVQTVVAAFGSILGSSAATVRDVAELPFPKEVIDKALLQAITMTSRGEMQEQFKSAYVMLADFQEMNAAEKSAVSSFSGSIEFFGTKDDVDLTLLAEQIASSGDTANSVQARVSKEGEQRLKSLSELESNE